MLCKKDLRYFVGNVLASDFFYADHQATLDWQKMGVLAVEMEAAALYMNAARAKKRALCMLTVSDEVHSGREISAHERQVGFTAMMEVALRTRCADLLVGKVNHTCHEKASLLLPSSFGRLLSSTLHRFISTTRLIRANARRLHKAFAWNPRLGSICRKATPIPHPPNPAGGRLRR